MGLRNVIFEYYNLKLLEQSRENQILMFYKGASKMRRDMINGEIANLRDLLPLPSSTRQRLSQLQLMALVCVYVRKSNYFSEGIYSFKDFYLVFYI